MDREKQAIERLKVASDMSLSAYGEPLIVCVSGGKDSGVLLHLARAAGIPFEVQHSHTTADAPETVYFIRKQMYELECDGIKAKIILPKYKGKRTSMWALIPEKKIPPTRMCRYCCDVLKEQNGKGRMIATGVRWDESNARKNSRGLYETLAAKKENKIILQNDNDDRRKLFENCKLKATRVANPIIDWTDREVWDYTRAENLPMNPMYKMGFTRAGCIGCPMAGKSRWEEFKQWPKYKAMYIFAFGRMLEARKAAGKRDETGKWKSAEGVFLMWMEDQNLDGQLKLEGVG